MVTLRLLFLILAFMLFCAAAFGVPSRVNLVAAGLAIWMLSLLVT